jgi:hypothetical protein
MLPLSSSANLFILSLFLAVLLTPGLVAQKKAAESKREFKKEGWLVPGIKNIDPRNAGYKGSENIDGIEIHSTSFSIPLEKQFTKVLVTTKSGETKEVEVNITLIVQYEYDRKVFCYMVECEDIDHGVRMGSSFLVAYYDDEGNSSFQARESIGPGWRVRLPDWVKKASQKQ